MIIRKKFVIYAATLFCLMLVVCKAEGAVLFDQEAVGSTVAIEESVIEPELIGEEDLPWWVYLWAGLLIVGAASMGLKSIKQQIRKPEKEPTDEQSPEPKE